MCHGLTGFASERHVWLCLIDRHANDSRGIERALERVADVGLGIANLSGSQNRRRSSQLEGERGLEMKNAAKPLISCNGESVSRSR